MSFCFTEKSYILGMWYQETKNGLINYLTGFWKEDGKWIGLQRKRTCIDDRIFDGDDKKEWTDFTPKNPDVTESEIIRTMDLIGAGALVVGLRSDRLLVQGDITKFLELAKTKSWIHMKCEKIH